MSDELKEKVNIDADSGGGLSQEKFADLFRKLDDDALHALLDRAGMTEDDLVAFIEQTETGVESTGEDAPGSEESSPVAENVSVAEESSGDEEAPVIEDDSGPEEDSVEETEAVQETDADEGLTPENIGHLLKVLGEDVINGMLESAGLTEEDLLFDDEQPEDVTAASGSKTVKRRRRRSRAKRRFLLLWVFVGIILLIFAVNMISLNVTLNSDDPIQYSEQVDDISAEEGLLKVNDVRVAVPTDGTEEYSISYSWAEDDGKYPSVPQAITAVYTNEEGAIRYSISLYRSETVPKKKLPKGKKASNWFDDWETVTEGEVLQKPLKSVDVNGFYIYPQQPEEGADASEYNDYSYYFAVKDHGGVSVYILEGVCPDEESAAEFPEIMNSCIKSITIEKPEQKQKDTDTEQA